jgi:hypothetical protein
VVTWLVWAMVMALRCVTRRTTFRASWHTSFDLSADMMTFIMFGTPPIQNVLSTVISRCPSFRSLILHGFIKGDHWKFV